MHNKYSGVTSSGIAQIRSYRNMISEIFGNYYQEINLSFLQNKIKYIYCQDNLHVALRLVQWIILRSMHAV